ncbi:PIR protein [Plasmodium vivax]|nr:PIR protein [Plasmodium vivax]
MSPNPSKNNYDFFQNMDHRYIYKAVNTVNSETRIELTSENSFINCTSSEITGNAETVCRKFNNLINLLYNGRSRGSIANFLKVNDYKYLSYWLLQEFKSNDVEFSDISENFYSNIKNNYKNFISKESLKRSVETIQPMNFEYMKILDNLYKNYSEFYTIISSGTKYVEESCNKYTQGCHDSYELGIQKCSDKSSELYKALQSFKETYENSFKFPDIGEICDSIKLKELRSYDEIKRSSTELITENDKNNMFTPVFAPTVGVLGTLIIFYKFTPLGPWLRNTVNKKKEIKNTINRETHGLLKGDENNNININNGPYNVKYHS